MPHKKILFRLAKDKDGYPPVDVEGVWAEEIGDNAFVVDNIPFFTRHVALGDVVQTQQIDGETFYKSTAKPSDNSLAWVVFFDHHDPAVLRSELSKLGCSTELSHIPSLVAVNIPSSVKIDRVRQVLDGGVAQGFWDYEEPIVRQ
ncbi:MAG: DUF4265 domain-containing protein [Planctomycetota bacterium]|nr:DUF4265 domain-containing protein [Planctomycetota bacterium]